MCYAPTYAPSGGEYRGRLESGVRRQCGQQSCGFEDDHWLCPIEDRRLQGPRREGLLQGFARTAHACASLLASEASTIWTIWRHRLPERLIRPPTKSVVLASWNLVRPCLGTKLGRTADSSSRGAAYQQRAAVRCNAILGESRNRHHGMRLLIMPVLLVLFVSFPVLSVVPLSRPWLLGVN